MIGQTISHYKILEKLGEGGMGVVYKAQDTNLDRLVALKFLPSNLSASDQDKTRFIQEAKAAAALNHPNICTIHDIQESDGQQFIVMEYVDGQTLQEKKKHGISFKQGIEIGIQIAEGLSAAHEKGIVHRDIKPENIMLRKDGIVQIMDFGLAKLRTAAGVSRLTKAGSTVGTLGYMSPEQVQGLDADHRSDIFSLGVVLYELMTGQMPFKGVHETAIMYEIVNVDAPPPSTVHQEIEVELDRIILECLQKEPDERYQSVKDLAKDLKRFKRESSRQRVSRITTARPVAKDSTVETIEPEKIQTKNYLWQLISALLVIVVVALSWRLWKGEGVTSRPVMRFSIDLPSTAPISAGLNTGLDISPNGEYLVYASLISGVPQLCLRRMDQLESHPITGTEGASYPFFSPDGQWVAFQVGDKLKKVSIFGGAPQDICSTDGQIRGGWWGSNNMIYYGHINKGVMQVTSGGGKPEEATTLDAQNNEISHRSPQLLPDGKTLMFTVKLDNIASFDEALIGVERLDKSEKKILVRGGVYARYLPTGHILYLRGKSFFVIPFDLDRLEVTGPPTQLFDGGWLNPFSGDASYCVSSSGVFTYVPLGSSTFDINTLVWMDRRGKTQTLLDKPRPYFNGTISPDGQKLALGINAANDDIWVYHITRGTLTRLTFGGGNNGFPIWTSDGKYIIYRAEKGKSPNLYRKQWDGSGAEERLTESDQNQIPTSISPDGKYLSFIQNGDIWILPLDGDRKPFSFIQSPADEAVAFFSPDGRWVAYQSNESGKYEVFVTSFPKREGKWQVSSGGGALVGWNRNGKELFYVSGTSLMVVDVTLQPTFDFTTPKKLCEIPSFANGPWDISPDGQRFLFIVSQTQQITTTKINVILEWFEELKEKFSGKKS